MPIITIGLFLLAIGGNPNLKIGVVNNEITSYNCFNSNHSVIIENHECKLNQISCNFISTLSDEYINTIFYQDFKKAYNDAKKGKITAIIYFNSNLTKAFQESYINRNEEDNDDLIEQSQIQIFMDQTDFHFTNFLTKQFYSSYQRFSIDIMEKCGFHKKYGLLPINFKKPIHGNLETDFKLFMTPPMVLVVLFYIAACSSSLVFVDERQSGIWNRTLLTGVNVFEVIISHVVTQSIILTVQLIGVFILIIVIFPVHEFNRIILIILIFTFVQFAGLFFGMILSCIVDTTFKVQFFLTGIAQCMLILSGE